MRGADRPLRHGPLFPDKAIDVLDEAGSRVRLAAAREPQELRDASAELERVRGERRRRSPPWTTRGPRRPGCANSRSAPRWRAPCGVAARRRGAPAQITAEHVAEVITSMTGIPAERVTDGEMDRLRGLRDHLMHRVVGQSEAVERISRSIRRSRAGLRTSTARSASSSSWGPRAWARPCWRRRSRSGSSTSAAA